MGHFSSQLCNEKSASSVSCKYPKTVAHALHVAKEEKKELIID